MFAFKQTLFIFCVIFGFCQSALATFSNYSPLQAGLVGSIEKCSIKDSECLTALYQKLLRGSADGIPEVGMPPTDPFVLKNVSVAVLDLITVTMVDAVATGVKNCKIHKVKADLEVKNFTMDFTCDMLVQGKYKLTSNPAAKNFIGGEVWGEGHVKAEIGKVRIRSAYEFFLRRGKDGDIYCDYKYEGMKFIFTFGKFKAHIDNIHIGDQDMSQVIVPILNNNWKFFLTTFGKPFVQKGMDYFFEYTHMFYDNVPAKKYIIEDLSPYL